MDLKLLQRQADELEKIVPELAPSALPTTCVAERDLLALAEREGENGCQALLEVLAAAGEGVEDCSICGEPGEVVIDPEAQESEAVALRVMLICRLQFLDKTLLPTKCQFACGLCRQLRNTGSLLQELASGRADEDGDTAAGLLEHLAIVNELPEVAENADACRLWGQELLARAYALQVVASGMHGWKLINPDGSPFQAGKTGVAADLALQLMLPEVTADQQQTNPASALGTSEQAPVQPAKDVHFKERKPSERAGKKARAEAKAADEKQKVALTATMSKGKRKQRKKSVPEASDEVGKARKRSGNLFSEMHQTDHGMYAYDRDLLPRLA